MGYQVGSQCFETKLQAENHYFSLVVPSFDSNGHIVKPEYNGSAWSVNGAPVSAFLPECDPLENFSNGAEIGWLIVGVMASLYVINIVKRLIK